MCRSRYLDPTACSTQHSADVVCAFVVETDIDLTRVRGCEPEDCYRRARDAPSPNECVTHLPQDAVGTHLHSLSRTFRRGLTGGRWLAWCVVGASKPYQVLVKGSRPGVVQVLVVHGDDTVSSLRQRVAALNGWPTRRLVCNGTPLLDDFATLVEAHVTAGAVLRVVTRGLMGGMNSGAAKRLASESVGDRSDTAFDTSMFHRFRWRFWWS